MAVGFWGIGALMGSALARAHKLNRSSMCRKMAQLSKAERGSLVAALTRYPLNVNGSEGFKKAEVTGGGLPLEHINCATMESRQLHGLHLCGEVLDVFGRIGGFNFYWWVLSVRTEHQGHENSS